MSLTKKIDSEQRHKYACHKSKAKHRGIIFNLTYEEWWDIWQKSGKWNQRGAGMNQYVMSRFNDAGAYQIGNVFIQLASENKKDGNLGRKCPRTPEHQAKITASLKKANLVPWNKGKPFPQAVINGKKSAAKQSATVIGRKRKYNEDGSWSWSYPQKVEV